MIKEKLSITLDILEKYPETRGDGAGKFLNKVKEIIYNNEVDFEKFSVEAWTRTRRKLLQDNPHLDNRTIATIRLVQEVLSEVC